MNKINVTSLALVTFFLAACGKQGEAQESTQVAAAPVAVVESVESSAEMDRDQLLARFLKIGVVVSDIEPSPELPGLLELTTNQGTFFSTADGSYFVPGTLFSLDENGNYDDVIAAKRGPKIVKLLEAQTDSMIEYKAEDEKHVVTVFTDITCGYCTKLHRNMKEYNDLGITVRYLAFPRAGDTSDVGTAMANIWCATDPKQAMNQSKLRSEFISETEVKDKDCRAMVSEQYQLGRTIGVNGTPAIYTESGINIGGYLDPDVMLNRLQN
ncbi:thiol:disulfide interchange protein [Vibrio sp. qd031]|uniref:thioredoxin fold domain-containing protein n=1 Tax=Vibrio sp. qd031 TaxID=1603038 RepID=UPI000A0FE89B|nr:thioredoxin fold domain-containing protein [Vibrio sp. qd031]ORT50533.1 thiol:disulfide interchange protein [Vibrio sp. qd031]